MAMAQCVAASFALNALGFLLSCCVLSSEYLFQCFFLGVKIFFSCDEDNVPKWLQYAENVSYIMYVKHVFNLSRRCTFIVLASLLLSQHRRDHVTRNQLTQSTENHLLLSLGGDNDLCLAKTLQAWTILNLIILGSLNINILKPSL